MKRIYQYLLILCPTIVMGLVPWISQAWTNPQSLRIDESSMGPNSALRKGGDPAGGFTGTGSPGRRSSGGARGDCQDLLVALIPGDGEISTSDSGCSLPSAANLALTADANPIVWIHVPAHEEVVEGQFALLDEQQIALSIQTIALPETAGIVGIQVDSELEIDETYTWVFSVLTDPQNPAENPRVSGTVSRIAIDDGLSAEIDAATSLRDEALVWIDYGIWHDAVTAIVDLRQSTPSSSTEIEQDWYDLLGSVGLSAIADAPIQDCCY